MGKRTIISLVVLAVLLGMVTGAQAGEIFECVVDCPEPEVGYELIGCTIAVNYEVDEEQGDHVPMNSPYGYVYFQSESQYDAASETSYDELIVCDYWKMNQTLPSGPEDLKKETLIQAISIYNQNLDTLPGFVHSILGDEIMHVYATLPDGSKMQYAAITESGKIVEGGNWIDFDEDGNYDLWQDNGIEPTLALYIDETGQITYEGLTFGTIVKEVFVSIGMKIASLFI